MPKADRKVKSSFWASSSRLIGVIAGSAIGSTLHNVFGSGIVISTVLLAIAFLGMWFAEFEREINRVSSEGASASSREQQEK